MSEKSRVEEGLTPEQLSEKKMAAFGANYTASSQFRDFDRSVGAYQQEGRRSSFGVKLAEALSSCETIAKTAILGGEKKVDPEYAAQCIETLHELKESLAVYKDKSHSSFANDLGLMADNLIEALRTKNTVSVSQEASSFKGYYLGLQAVNNEFMYPTDKVSE